MANTLLTVSMITVRALQLFRNSNAFLKNISRENEHYFGNQPLQIGSTLQIRKPTDPTLRYGATASAINSVEQQIPLVINSLIGVDLAFTDTDFALSIANFSDRFIKPAVNKLGGGVALQIMNGVDTGGTASTGGQQTTDNNSGGISNVVNNTASGINATGGQATISPDATSFGYARALLTELGAPMDDRVMILHPFSQSNMVASVRGLLNPVAKISTQYEKGIMSQNSLGFDKWLEDPSVITHTEAAFGTLANVSGGSQTGSTITTSALNGPLSVGDIISFTGVNMVNPTTKQDSGKLMTFVVTAAAIATATTVSIYPPLTPTGTGASQVQFGNVTASPANNAPLLSPIAASQVYRKNLGFHPSAVQAAFIKLPENEPGTESKSEMFDGLSLRLMHYYNGANMTGSWRLDTLFGAVWARPEWGVIVCDTQ